ncbi:MAG: endonuclease/exonuclease/phosphatase family protein [Croceimicrobium sp.]
MKYILPLVLTVLSFSLGAQVEDFKIVSYNLLNYNPNNIDDRHDEFRLIMNEIQPDLLVVQEVDGLSAVQMFADSVLNVDSVTYGIGSFIDGPDSDVGLFYKSRIFRHLSVSNYSTNLRDIVHHQLKTDLNGRAGDTNVVLHVFGLHLKASSGSANRALRKAEIDSLNKVLQFLEQEPVIVCGDFNIYGSTEAAYQALLKEGGGFLYDTLNLVGTWNTGLYAPYHTQSPRTTRFNGGANGGLDDRFDMILFSKPIAHDSIYGYNGDMEVFGNDGQHYNMALTDPPQHPSLSDSIINALHYASDHLPLMASFYNGQRGLSRPIHDIGELYLAQLDKQHCLINKTGQKLFYRLYLISGELKLSGEFYARECLSLSKGAYLIEVLNNEGERVLIEKLIY